MEDRRRRTVGRLIPIGGVPLAVVLAVGLVAPLAVFVMYSFWTSDIFGLRRTWTLDRYRSALSDFYLEVLARTLATALVIAAVVVIIAYAAAYLITFRIRRGKTLFVVLIVASALTSYLVRIYAWKTVLGPRGAVNSALERLGAIDDPLTFLLYNRFSVSLALVQILLPFAFLPIYAAMQSVDSDLLSASRDLGAGPLQTFQRVLWPLTRNGVATAFVFSLIIAGGDYVTPEMLGGKNGLMTGRIVSDQFGLTQNYALASALAVVLLAGFLLILGVLALMRVVAGRLSVQRRRGPRARLGRRRERGWLGSAFLVAVVAYLYVPLVAVIALSVNDSRFSTFPMQGLTVRWYEQVLSAGQYRTAFITSVEVAIVVTVGALVIGIPAAFALFRRRFLLRPVLTLALIACLGLPGIVIGFAIFSMWRQIGFDPSLVSVVLGQLIVVLPFVVLTIGARVQRMDASLEEAGRDLGCSRLGVVRRITAPLIAPVVLAAALVAFSLSMDEFVVTHFTIGDRETFPVLIWSQLHRRGLDPSVNAAATILVATTLMLFALLALFARSRRGRDARGIVATSAWKGEA
jgi:ABC-type spermidine/putrescine transport system permease subunit I